MVKANLSTNTQGSGDIRASLSNPENRSKVNQISTINQSMDEEGGQTIILAKQKVIEFNSFSRNVNSPTIFCNC